MVVPGRHRSIAFFIALGVGLISVILLLYIGWVLLNWRTGILFFFSFLLTALIVSGVILNTTFLVREIRRNEQHDAFINAVTHELKTPVASIRLYLETLQTRSVDENKRREFYQIMLDDSDRLFATIEQILRAGRLGASRRKTHVAPVDLDTLIEGIVARARVLHHLEPEALIYHPSPAVKIMGDEEDLRAAVANLVDNAVKYSGAGARVRVESKLEGKYVSVIVKDNGVGIPKSELRRIFKRFYRVGMPGMARVKGTGLGLFIVRSVARRHGGSAWAESEGAGHGSTFVLQLPISK
jgi:two-component system, OmpR family, sensor histidine kinase SenX3